MADKENLELLTISRMKALRMCERYHCYAYELGRRPIKIGIAMFFGTLFHHGLERWWMLMWDRQQGFDLTDDQILEHSIYTIRDRFNDEISNATAFDLVKAEELMRGYHARWLGCMDDIEIWGVELEFKTKMVNPESNRASKTFRLGGKIDVFIRRISEDKKMVIEHKTTTLDINAGSEYWQKLRMDGQVSQYIDGVRQIMKDNGEEDEVVDCLYDVAKRPMLKPYDETPDENKRFTKGKSCKTCRTIAKSRTKEKLLVSDIPPSVGCAECEQPRLDKRQHDHDETPEEFRLRLRDKIAEDPNGSFQRATIIRLEGELEDYRYDTWDNGLTIRRKQIRAKKLGIRAWARNHEACHKRGKCQYYGACSGYEDINDDHIFRTTKQHEELTGQSNAPTKVDPVGEIFGDNQTQQDVDPDPFNMSPDEIADETGDSAGVSFLF